MVEDLAVVDDHGVAVVAMDGLIATGDVDNAEADSAHGDRGGSKDALLIGPAVHNGLRQLLNEGRGRSMIQSGEAGYAAQGG